MVEGMRSAEDIPVGLADRWEKLVDLASKRLFEKRAKMKEIIGIRPYKALPVSEAERLKRFSQIWHDPVALAEILKQNAKFKPDGRVLIPRALMDTMKTMTRKLRESGVQ